MRQQLAGKTILVTGATSGIGFATAKALAAMGAEVLIVGRDPQRARDSAGQIRGETGSTSVRALTADLSSMEDVRVLAQVVQRDISRLDGLINNAGAVFLSRQTTIDGFERTFALNHLAPFLLTSLLLDTLKASEGARIITVSSMMHNGQRIHLDDLQQEHRRYSGWRAYGESKLANIMFTYALARRLAGTDVTANTLHPGSVGSNFATNNGAFWRFGMSIARRFELTPEQGARTSVYLASSPEVAGKSSGYYVSCRLQRSSAASYDEAAQEQLWAASERMTGVTTPAI